MGLPGFGKGRVSNEREYEEWTLKDGQPLVCTPMPPMHSLAETGDWFLFYSVHWGWKGVSEKDPTKGAHRPFLCVEESTGKGANRVITRECPACNLIREWEKRKEIITGRMTAEGATEEQISAALKAEGVTDWLKEHSLDRKARLVVVDLANKVGILKITWTCLNDLRNKFTKLIADGYDPLFHNGNVGVRMEFSRTGKFPVTDVANPYTEMQTFSEGGRTVRAAVISTHEITDDLAEHVLSVIPDLVDMREALRYTPEQIQALVDSSGDPQEVDQILGARRPAPRSPKAARRGSEAKAAATAPVAAAKSAEAVKPGGSLKPTAPVAPKAPVKPVAPPAEAVQESSEEDDLAAQMAALQAKMAAKKAAAAVKVTPKAVVPTKPLAKPAVSEPESSSPDEYEEMFQD